MSARRLRANDLGVPFHGIRVVEEIKRHSEFASESVEARRARMTRELRERCVAFRVREGRPVIFSHTTAARLWGLPVPNQLEDRSEIDVAALTPHHAPQGAGVIGHRLRPWRVSVREVGGLEVVSPIDAWVQLGGILDVADLVVIADALVRRKSRFTTIAHLHGRLEREQRTRGIRRLRVAVELARAGTDSPMETRVRLLIVAAGLPEPVVGYRILDRDGGFVAVPDLAFVAERIAIEYDGDVHRTDRYTFVSDIDRYALMEEAGWVVFRIVNEHLRNPENLVIRLNALLASRS